MPDNIEARVTRLEKDMDDLCGDVKQIMQNHLPHINQELISLRTQLKIYGGLIIAGVTALIILGLTP
jgi:hypothetical protein